MELILIEADPSDIIFIESIKQVVPKAEVVEESSFFGMQDAIHLLVPLSTAIAGILVKYFAEQSKIARARAVLVKGNRIDIHGYSAEEVVKILSASQTSLPKD